MCVIGARFARTVQPGKHLHQHARHHRELLLLVTHTGDGSRPLSKSPNGNSYILVIGDYFTCWMEALPLPNQEAGTVAGKLVDEVFLCFPSQSSYIQIKAYSLSPSL